MPIDITCILICEELVKMLSDASWIRAAAAAATLPGIRQCSADKYHSAMLYTRVSHAHRKDRAAA